jgi:DNA polymerase
MDRAASPSLADELAAAQEWWREAGVDCAFQDEPVAWLKDAEVEAETPQPTPAVAAVKQPAPPPLPSIGGNAENWPADPEGFAQWWLTEPSLDTGGANPRIAPRGQAGAKLMVLVPQPEQEDRDRLLSGPQGKLLASFLNAAGLTEEEIYLASALPRHVPHPDWRALTSSGLGKIALHHAAIARPERLVLFGNDVLALIENNPAQNPAFLLHLNHQGRSVPALAARSLEHMLNIPSARSRFWRDWLDWTDG